MNDQKKMYVNITYVPEYNEIIVHTFNIFDILFSQQNPKEVVALE